MKMYKGLLWQGMFIRQLTKRQLLGDTEQGNKAPALNSPAVEGQSLPVTRAHNNHFTQESISCWLGWTLHKTTPLRGLKRPHLAFLQTNKTSGRENVDELDVKRDKKGQHLLYAASGGSFLQRLSLTHTKPIIRRRVGRSAPTVVGLIPSEKGRQRPGFDRELAEQSLQSSNPFCIQSGKCWKIGGVWGQVSVQTADRGWRTPRSPWLKNSQAEWYGLSEHAKSKQQVSERDPGSSYEA